MATEIATIELHAVPKGSALDKSEHELAEAMASEFEAFYRQGLILERISKGEFRDAGYSSFKQYVNERQPLGIKKSQAFGLINAKNVRHLLPTFESAPRGLWTEYVIRPLTHKDFAPSDVKRLGKKIATQVKKGQPLTASLVKKICDDDRGVDRQKKKKAEDRLVAADTAATVIRKLKVDADLWLKSLAELPASFWEEAEEDAPGCTKRAIQSLSELVSFLRS